MSLLQVAHLSESGALIPILVCVVASNPHACQFNSPYSLHLRQRWQSGEYSWGIDPESSLPRGLKLSSDGVITGTPKDYFESHVVVVKVVTLMAPLEKRI